MSLLNRTITWWNGTTFGARLSLRGATEVGRDGAGNIYYAEKKGVRRWVAYNGIVDASRIPPDWHLWMHGADMPPPSKQPLPTQRWVKPPVANLTGTAAAHMPSGALEKSGVRARATGDYEAWSPGE